MMTHSRLHAACMPPADSWPPGAARLSKESHPQQGGALLPAITRSALCRLLYSCTLLRVSH